MTIDICLPLAKYSYAIGCDSKTNTIPWEHLSAVDLFVVIKGEGSNDATGPLSLKIIHATKVLEKIDIDRFIERAIETRTAIERQGTSASIEQLPIFGITKENLLALRYRLKNGQDHRTQLRMQTAADCRQIVDLFRWRGMEFREASARPSTSRAVGRPSTAQSDFRPLTAQSSSPYFSKGQHDNTRPSTTHGPPPHPGSQLRQSHRVESLQHDDDFRASPAIEDMPPPRIIKRGEKVAPGEFAIERPTTAQMWRTRTAPNQPSGIAVAAAQYTQTGPASARPSSYNNIDDYAAIRQAVEEDTNVGEQQPPIVVPPLQQEGSSGALDLPYMSQSSDNTRPLTAVSATSLVLPGTQDVEISMKHELNSNVPQGRRSGSSSRPSSALDLPPLPKPQVEQRPSTSFHDQTTTPTPVSRGTWATDNTVQKRPFSSASASFHTTEDYAEPRKVIFSKQSQAQAATHVAQHDADPQETFEEPLPMDELLRRTREERLKEAALRRHSSMADAPHELESPPPAPAPPSRQMAKDSRRISPQTSAPSRREEDHGSRRHMPAKDRSLDEFAAQRPEDRQAALDDFMIENLENPSFTTLCEDVENCWRRIALGL